MANDAKLKIVIEAVNQTKAELDKVKADLAGLSTSAKSASSGFDSLTGSLGSLAAKASIAVAAFAGFSAIKNLVSDATMLASRVETLGTVLTVVGKNTGYSAGEMQRYVDGVKKMGITTQEAMSSVTKMAQANIDLSKSSQLARIAQDAAVIGNVNSSEALGKMVHGIQSAQIEVLRTIGINVNFEQSYKKMAAQLGKNTDQLTEQEKIQARVNAVMEQGANIAGVYDAAMGTAGKQLNSMARYSEEALLAFGKLFTPAFSSIILDITDKIKEVGNALKSFESSEGGAALKELFQDAAESVLDFGDEAWETLKPIGQIVLEVAKVIGFIKPWEPAIILAKGALILVQNVLQPIADLASFINKNFKEWGGNISSDKAVAGSQADMMNKYNDLLKKRLQLTEQLKAAEGGGDKGGSKFLNKLFGGDPSKVKKELDEINTKIFSLGRALDSAYQQEQQGVVEKQTEKVNQTSQDKLKAAQNAEKQITQAIKKEELERDGVSKDFYEKAVERINAQAEEYKSKGVSLTSIDKFVAVSKENAFREAYEKQSDAARKASDDAVEAMQKEADAGVKVTEAKLKGIEKYKDMVSEEAEFASTENERQVNAIIASEQRKLEKLQDLYNRGYITFEEYEKLKVKITENTKAAILEKETEHAAKITKLNADLIANIKGYEAEYYAARLAQIEAQADKYIKDGAERVKVEAWVRDQQIDAFKKMAEASDDFVLGVQAGLLDLAESQRTWGSAAKELTLKVFGEMQNAISDTFFGLITGELDDLSEIWDRTWKNLLKTFIDIIAEMITKWLAFKALTALGININVGGGGGGGGSLVNTAIGAAWDYYSGGSSGGGLVSGITNYFGIGSGTTTTGAAITGMTASEMAATGSVYTPMAYGNTWSGISAYFGNGAGTYGMGAGSSAAGMTASEIAATEGAMYGSEFTAGMAAAEGGSAAGGASTAALSGTAAAVATAATALFGAYVVYKVIEGVNKTATNDEAQAKQAVAVSLQAINMAMNKTAGEYQNLWNGIPFAGEATKAAQSTSESGVGFSSVESRVLNPETATDTEKIEFIKGYVEEMKLAGKDAKLTSEQIQQLTTEAIGPQNAHLAKAIELMNALDDSVVEIGKDTESNIPTIGLSNAQLVEQNKAREQAQILLKGMDQATIEAIPNLSQYGEALAAIGVNYDTYNSQVIDAALLTQDFKDATDLLTDGLQGDEVSQFSSLLDRMKSAIQSNGESILDLVPDLSQFSEVLRQLGINIQSLPESKTINLNYNVNGIQGMNPDGSPIMHSGGFIGAMHSGGFVKYHPFGGRLGYDEVPFIGQRGEYVLSKKDVEFIDKVKGNTAPKISVMVNNHLNKNADAEAFINRVDDEYIINVILKDAARGGRIYQNLGWAYNG